MREVNLGSVADVWQSFSTQRSKALNGQGRAFPVVKLTDLAAFGVLDSSTLERTVLDPEKVKEEHFLVPDDVLLSSRGYGFDASIVSQDVSPNTLPSSSISVLRVRSSDILPAYIAGLLRSSYGAYLMTPYLTGSAQKMITATSLRELTVPIPEMRVQAHLADLFRAAATYERSVHALTTQRQNLVDDLFLQALSGRAT